MFRNPIPAVGILLWSGLSACHQSAGSANLAENPKAGTVACSFAKGDSGQIKTFAALKTFALGPSPGIVELEDESNPGSMRLNPAPEDADSFIRAASAVQILHADPTKPLTFVSAQDSRRKLGIATFRHSLEDLVKDPASIQKLGRPVVQMIPLASPEVIAQFEDDRRDYNSVRKKTKADYEAATTLPDGDILVLGSGSDMLKHLAGKPSYRSEGHRVDGNGTKIASYQLLSFYRQLQQNRDLIGPDNDKGPAELNIEGVAVRPANQGHIISFFHRGNGNENGHNAVIDYDYERWLEVLEQTQVLDVEEGRRIWEGLQARRVVQLTMPTVATDMSSAPLSLNDALFGYSEGRTSFLIPVGVELEYKDAQGAQQDGGVVFVGLARWQGIEDPAGSRCEIFQAPGDPAPGEISKFGKLEGLAAYSSMGTDLFHKSLYHDDAFVIGVTDVDAEIKPAQVSVIKVPN